MAKSLRQRGNSSYLLGALATRCGIDDGIGPSMADKDLFEDGRGKNALKILRLSSGRLAIHDPEVPYSPLAQVQCGVRFFAYQRSVYCSHRHPAPQTRPLNSRLEKGELGGPAIQQQARMAIGLYLHRYLGLIPILVSFRQR